MRELSQVVGLPLALIDRYIDEVRREGVDESLSTGVDRLHKSVEQEFTNRLSDEIANFMLTGR